MAKSSKIPVSVGEIGEIPMKITIFPRFSPEIPKFSQGFPGSLPVSPRAQVAPGDTEAPAESVPPRQLHRHLHSVDGHALGSQGRMDATS